MTRGIMPSNGAGGMGERRDSSDRASRSAKRKGVGTPNISPSRKTMAQFVVCAWFTSWNMANVNGRKASKAKHLAVAWIAPILDELEAEIMLEKDHARWLRLARIVDRARVAAVEIGKLVAMIGREKPVPLIPSNSRELALPKNVIRVKLGHANEQEISSFSSPEK